MTFEDILSICLEEMAHGRSIESLLARFPAHAAELEPLLRLCASLSGHAAPRMSNAAFERGRAELARQAASQLHTRRPVPAPAKPNPLQARAARPLRPIPSRPKTFAFPSAGQLFASAAAFAAALLIGLSIGRSAQTALPGDSLYGVKRAAESAQGLAQAASGDSTAWQIDQADRRLDEALALQQAGVEPGPTVVATVRQSVDAALIASAELPPAERLPLLDNWSVELAQLAPASGAPQPALAGAQAGVAAALVETQAEPEAIAAAPALPTPSEAFGPAALAEPAEQSAEPIAQDVAPEPAPEDAAAEDVEDSAAAAQVAALPTATEAGAGEPDAAPPPAEQFEQAPEEALAAALPQDEAPPAPPSEESAAETAEDSARAVAAAAENVAQEQAPEEQPQESLPADEPAQDEPVQGEPVGEEPVADEPPAVASVDGAAPTPADEAAAEETEELAAEETAADTIGQTAEVVGEASSAVPDQPESPLAAPSVDSNAAGGQEPGGEEPETLTGDTLPGAEAPSEEAGAAEPPVVPAAAPEEIGAGVTLTGTVTLTDSPEILVAPAGEPTAEPTVEPTVPPTPQRQSAVERPTRRARIAATRTATATPTTAPTAVLLPDEPEPPAETLAIELPEPEPTAVLILVPTPTVTPTATITPTATLTLTFESAPAAGGASP